MENRLNWSILIAVIFGLVAVVRIPCGSELRALFEFSARIGIVILLAVYLIEKVDVWVGSFLLLALFAHSLPWFVMSRYQYIQTQESYIALHLVVLSCILYSILSTVKLDMNILLNLMCVIGLINVVFLLLQKTGTNPYVIFGIKGNLSPTGLMANRNEVGALFAIITPAFFRKGWAWSIPILILGIFLSDSLNGVLGFSAALFVYMSLNEYRFIAAMGAIAVIFAFVFSGDTIEANASITNRLYIWEKSLILQLKNQPVLGFGLGNWKIVDIELAKAGQYPTMRHYSRLHNTFVQGYVEMGMGFIVLLCAYVISILKRVKTISPVTLSALAAIFVCCNTNSVFRMNAINGMFIILWLSTLKRNKHEEKEKKDSLFHIQH